MHGKSIRILTNMTFWQSPLWMANTTSIYSPPQDRDQPGALKAGQEAWTLFLRRQNFEVVLTMGDRTSLYYGLLCALFCKPSRQVMTEVFIDHPRPHNPAWRTKIQLYRLIASRALGILANSSEEVASIARRFALPPEKLRFVPMHTNILHPQAFPAHEGPILSAGRTLRDYSTLLKAARPMAKPFVIICGRDDLRNETPPSHIQILRDIHHEAYLEQLQKASLVVLPLVDTERSTGQVVLLEAMAYGKPVIATRSPGTSDIIQDGHNGLLVPPCQPAELRKAMESLLQSPTMAQSLAEKALASVLTQHTLEIHARRKLEAVSSFLDWP